MRSVFIAIVLLGLCATAALAQVPLSGLSTDFRMDGVDTFLPDRSGLDNHGATVGEARFVFDRQMGNALEIYGNSGAVIVPHCAALEPATGTIQVWINLNQLTNADIFMKATSRLLRTNRDVGISVYGLRVDEAGRVIAYIANNDDPSWWTWVTVNAHRLVPGHWYMLTLRWDGQRVSVFLNDTFHISNRYNPVPEVGLSYYKGSPLYIGYPSEWSGSVQNHFVGRIARLRIYDRALTNDEIAAAYAAEAPVVTNNWPR